MQMKLKQVFFIDPEDVIRLFKEATGISLWSEGAWRCPETHTAVELDDGTLHYEQDYLYNVAAPEDRFKGWNGKDLYLYSKEEAIEQLKELKPHTYGLAMSFLAVYGYLPKADVYTLTNMPLDY